MPVVQSAVINHNAKEIPVRRVKKHIYLIGATLALLLAVACGPAGPETTGEVAEAASDVPETTDAEEAEEAELTGVVNDTEAVETAELEYIEIEAGTGAQARPGDIVSVHYTGTLEDGTVFDSSIESGQPFTFMLGQGQVIAGWDQGIALMREGGKATFVVPPELAYGEAGRDQIPPNATLTFEVELVEVIAAPEPSDIALEEYEVTESGLRYFDIEPGTDDSPAAGDAVTLHFHGWLEDGTSLGGTQDGPPASFQIGSNQVFPGLEEGVSTMQIGGQRQLLIPPELAFGEAGSSSIPPNATIILEVSLLNIIPLPEAAVFPEIDEAEYEETASGLKYYDVEVGEGASPQPGQQVQVHYTGWFTDGTKFDSSIDRGLPFPFPLGLGSVIPGWDEGVATMQIGGIRLLIIPPELAYGPEGNQGIPPNSILIFEVHLLDAQ
jgi:peptidylprolyl isomerase